MEKLTRLQLFALLVIFLLAASSEMSIVEAKLLKKMSKTWSGFCGSSANCDVQCKEWEGAMQGSCDARFPGWACFCYFNKMPKLEAKLKSRPSKTWSGFCTNSAKCDQQCREREGTEHGACHWFQWKFPQWGCFCYFHN